MDLAVPADYRVKIKESEKIDKYLDLSRELRKQWKLRVTLIPIVIGGRWTVSKSFERGLAELKIRGRIGDNPNYCIVSVSQNTEKSPGDQKRLAITQDPVKYHQLTVVREKNSIEIK